MSPAASSRASDSSRHFVFESRNKVHGHECESRCPCHGLLTPTNYRMRVFAERKSSQVPQDFINQGITVTLRIHTDVSSLLQAELSFTVILRFGRLWTCCACSVQKSPSPLSQDRLQRGFHFSNSGGHPFHSMSFLFVLLRNTVSHSFSLTVVLNERRKKNRVNVNYHQRGKITVKLSSFLHCTISKTQ